MELSITIPAKAGNREGVYPVVTRGEVFACIAATAEFEVKPDYGDRRTARKGSTWGNPGAREFRALIFYNTSATAIDVTFFAGAADNRPNTPLADGNVVIVTDPTENTAVLPTEGIYLLAGAGVEPITADATLFFQRIFIHPAKAAVAGVLTPNTNDIRIGRSVTHLPFLKAAGDVDVPVYYELPVGQKMKLNQIHVKGTAGDGVFFSYL